MASDVLVSESQTGGEFDIMTSNNGEQVDSSVVVDLMSSPANGVGSGSEDAAEADEATAIQREVVEEEEVTTVDHVSPVKLKKPIQAENNGVDDDENGEPQQCNGDSAPATNGVIYDEVAEEGKAVENGDENGVIETNGHRETVTVNEETSTSPDGEVVTTTTTTTVVKVDEEEDEDGGKTVMTSVKTTTITSQSSELVVEVGSNDAPPVQSHELAAAIIEEEPPVEEVKEEEIQKDAAEKREPEEAVAATEEPVKEKEKHKEGAARRLFNFVRSPAKAKSVDDPTVAGVESKAKSPTHQRRLFGWRKTWTPEKVAEEKPAEAAEGEDKTEGAQEAATLEKVVSPKKKLRLGLMKKSKSTNSPSKPSDSVDKPCEATVAERWAAEECAEPAEQQKPAETAVVEEKPSEEPVVATEAETTAEQSTLDTSAISKPDENEGVTKSASKKKKNKKKEKKDKKKKAAAEKKEEQEKPADVSVTEKWVAESCGERPSSPVKEETVAVVAAVVAAVTEEETKDSGEPVNQPEEPAAEKKQEEPKETEKTNQKGKKGKPSNVRKSWTFRVNRSATQDEKLASKATNKEAPAALAIEESTEAAAKPSNFSPGKPFFASLLHRKKQQKQEPKQAEEPQQHTQTEEKVEEKAADEETAAAPPSSSKSMPHLTPEKRPPSAAEKWAAEECAEPAHAVSSTDVVADLEPPATTSTAVKKEPESSPMRRSASLRMPSSLSRFFRFLGPRHRTTTVGGNMNEEAAAIPSTPPPGSPAAVPHTTSLTTPVSPPLRSQEAPATDGKQQVTTTPGRHGTGFRFWSNWRSSGGPSTFGKWRSHRKEKKDAATHDDTSLIVNTSLIVPAKSATLHDMPRGEAGQGVDLGAILARLPPQSPDEHSPTYLGISRVLNGYAEYNSPTRRSGASSSASHKSPGGTVTTTLEENTTTVVESSNGGTNGGSLLQPAFLVQKQQTTTTTVIQSSEAGTCRDAHSSLATADAEQARLEERCNVVKCHLDAPELTAEARGQIEATVGKTNLLLSQKFKQFRDLCHESLKPAVEGQTPPPNPTDLAGFWDLVLIQVADLDRGFEAIELMKQNSWQQVQPVSPVDQKDGSAISNAQPADKKKKKKKQDKSKKNKAETESGDNSSTAAATAKSRFAEFKQRMFKRSAAAPGETNGTAATNGCETTVNGVNGEASASASAGGEATTVKAEVEEAKS